jgi:Short C-terminal domain
VGYKEATPGSFSDTKCQGSGHVPAISAAMQQRSSRYEPPLEDIEAKLRKLASLKDQNLISEEEYHRKRQDSIERW